MDSSVIVVSTGTANFAAGVLIFDDNSVFLPLSGEIPKLLKEFNTLLAAGEMTVVFQEVDLVKREGYVVLQSSTMITESPACDICGSITVRTGQLYRCLYCGNKMGT